MIVQLTKTYLVMIIVAKMVEEKFLQVDGHKIRYLESGTSKKTLVLVHGLGASSERWTQVIPLFSEYFRVVIPDLIGFGKSDKPATDYTINFFVDFLDLVFYMVLNKTYDITLLQLNVHCSEREREAIEA